jgi:crotonobetainyl-CoA:carnitine CoA-transferase CaiB-like acyl-CoA transferase
MKVRAALLREQPGSWQVDDVEIPDEPGPGEVLVEMAHAAGIARERVNYPRELIAHPQLAVRLRWRDVDSRVGPLRALLPPPVSEGWPLRMGRIPDVGVVSEPVEEG